MSPISKEDAFAQTNPADTEENRNLAASRIVAGVAASDAYWNSRGRLEALEAQSQGHGVVIRATDGEDPTPLAGGTTTEPAIDSTAEDETTALSPAAESKAAAPPPPAAAPSNPMETVARLRKQLQDAGQVPEA